MEVLKTHLRVFVYFWLQLAESFGVCPGPIRQKSTWDFPEEFYTHRIHSFLVLIFYLAYFRSF